MFESNETDNNKIISWKGCINDSDLIYETSYNKFLNTKMKKVFISNSAEASKMYSYFFIVNKFIYFFLSISILITGYKLMNRQIFCTRFICQNNWELILHTKVEKKKVIFKALNLKIKLYLIQETGQ